MFSSADFWKLKLRGVGDESIAKVGPLARSTSEKVLSIPQPRRLGELEDIIYGVNWLSSSIPELAELKASFQDLMLKIKN